MTSTDIARPTWKYDPAKELEAHPLANIFPLMEGKEFDVFVEDIKANGLREPITIFEDKILEGRNRYRAIVKASRYRLKEENFRPYTGTDPLAFVISANVHRRHLDTSQRAMTAAKLVTSKLGDNQHKNGLTIGQAATMLNVSEALVKIAKDTLDKAAPEVLAAVQSGKKRLGAVKDLLNKSKAEQVAELSKKPERKTTTKPKVPKANQAVLAFEAFKKQWQGFDEMAKRAFVIAFKADIRSVLEYVDQQDAMAGAGS
jgi:hypothetical protein